MTKKKIDKWETESFEMEKAQYGVSQNEAIGRPMMEHIEETGAVYCKKPYFKIFNAGDLLLDQFAGGGTALIEAKLPERNIIGVDINSNALKRCSEKCDFQHDSDGKVYIKRGDSRKLDFIPNCSIDFICTHLHMQT